MPALRGVLDANLLATALVSERGPGNALLRAARFDQFTLVVSEYLLNETRETLIDAFGLHRELADELLAVASQIAEHIEPTRIEAIREPRRG